MKIVIQGFGVVGAATALNIVSSNNFRNNFKVHCVERRSAEGNKKVYMARKGICPIQSNDKSLDLTLKKALNKKKISFGFDYNGYSKSNVIVVTINCDLKDKNSINIKEFLSSFSDIAYNISPNTLILIESTVPPGTCKKLLYPMLKKILKKRSISLSKVFLAHSFERVTPGNNYLSSCKNSYKVFSGINKASEIRCLNFLKRIVNYKKFPPIKLKDTVSSEICKLMENSYRAVNIAFIDEWVKFSQKLKIDLFDIISTIKMRNTHKNLMLPGIGVGGYCLTKDPIFAKIGSKKIFNYKNFDFPLSTKAISINEKMPITSFNFIKENIKFSLRNKNILIYGMTYKEDIGDIRFSPSIVLAKKLIKEKSNIFFYDPLIKNVNEKKFRYFNIYKEKMDFDIKIFTVKHKNFFTKKFENNFLLKNSIIFDLNNVLEEKKIKEIKKKNKLFILGRH
jgi:UDP-N-acetyl-D-glucosamine dehydrogenase